MILKQLILSKCKKNIWSMPREHLLILKTENKWIGTVFILHFLYKIIWLTRKVFLKGVFPSINEEVIDLEYHHFKSLMQT